METTLSQNQKQPMFVNADLSAVGIIAGQWVPMRAEKIDRDELFVISKEYIRPRALFEMGRYDEAKTVFETALSLDPENLIALRHLGDIARLANDNETARAWYQRVLEADPRNEEITQLLSSLPAATAPASASQGPATRTPTTRRTSMAAP